MSFIAPQTVGRELLARGLTIDGRQVSVHKIYHERPVAGLGDVAFAVDIGGNDQTGAVSVGFISDADAFRYVHSLGTQDYDVIDPRGERIKEQRTGLGVPEGMLSRVDGVRVNTAAPVVQSVIPPNAAQYPQAAAAMNAPSDAADQPHGNLSGAGEQAQATMNTREGAGPHVPEGYQLVKIEVAGEGNVDPKPSGEDLSERGQRDSQGRFVGGIGAPAATVGAPATVQTPPTEQAPRASRSRSSRSSGNKGNGASDKK